MAVAELDPTVAVTDAAPRPPLVVAAAPVHMSAPAADADAEDANAGKGFVIGSIIGFVVVFTLYTTITLIAGVSVGAAVGVGLFTAFWGGPGFGGMLGAVLYHEHREAG